MPRDPKKPRDHSRRHLNARQEKFVELYLSGMGAKKAAAAAGYSAKTAHARASTILRCQAVKTAIDAARAIVTEKIGYTTTQAMSELDDAIKFARETSNASAMAKCIETKAKIMGLMTEKPAATAAFQINIVGLEQQAAPPMVTVEGIENG